MPRSPFTVDDANALIPTLEEALDRLESLRAEWTTHMRRAETLEVMWGELIFRAENPNHLEYLDIRDCVERTGSAIQNLVEEKIVARGLRFPSGSLEHGIIDFPTTWEGRWIYLCWRRGEPQLTHWHEIDSGFQGRQEIQAEHIITMGREKGELPNDMGLDF
ncbi:MAG: DUF2203 family protein [Candidatus Latescibacterota bacterium]|nr:DUF2203 family protein [Candidatus Latescibacterota bacterium]